MRCAFRVGSEKFNTDGGAARRNIHGRTVMKYIDVRQARTTPGLKLVLTAGVPGPWSEAIKMMLEFKRITYIPVIQHMGQANDDLVEWVGVRTAPVIVNGSDAPLTGWADMLMFAERSAPNPPLLPEDS